MFLLGSSSEKPQILFLNKYIYEQNKQITLFFFPKKTILSNFSCFRFCIFKKMNISWEAKSKFASYLLCLSFLIAFFSCLWLLLLTSETCSIFWFPVVFLVRKRSFQRCSYCPVHLKSEKKRKKSFIKVILEKWMQHSECTRRSVKDNTSITLHQKGLWLI